MDDGYTVLYAVAIIAGAILVPLAIFSVGLTALSVLFALIVHPYFIGFSVVLLLAIIFSGFFS